MKISYNWLRDYVDIDISPEILAQDISLFGHEVENIDKFEDDYIFNFEITPNRGDCLSIRGIAREIAALYNIKLKDDNIKFNETKLDKKLNVNIVSKDICPRFSARVIDNIKIDNSPDWLKKRINSLGIRSVNNIVDITNYVMLASGQPLHAFDYDKITNAEMKICLSKNGDYVTTLDGKESQLDDNNIIIKDKDKIYDLAGIMGGKDSQVDDNTTTIILQSAVFDPILIRRSSKKLKIQTEASYRYERGVDIEGTVTALDLACSLISGLNKEIKISKLIDIYTKKDPIQIKIDNNKINNLIGINLNDIEITKYLSRLNFKKENDIVSVPSYRSYDVKIWQDIAEEIARVYGFNKIQKQYFEKIKTMSKSEWQKREIIKDICKENSFTEIYSYSFADLDKMKLLDENIENCIETANPISPELKYLRMSLKSSILNQIAKNPWDPQINIFELEKVFDKNEEKYQLALATTGKQEKYLTKIKEELNIKTQIETVNQDILNKFKIRRQVKILLCDIDDIAIKAENISLNISKHKYRDISKFPPTIRDLAFIVANDIDTNDIKNMILGASDAVLLTENFDEYSSDKFGINSKNVAFHIWLQNNNNNISVDEANAIINNIIKLIEDKFQAKLRS